MAQEYPQPRLILDLELQNWGLGLITYFNVLLCLSCKFCIGIDDIAGHIMTEAGHPGHPHIVEYVRHLPRISKRLSTNIHAHFRSMIEDFQKRRQLTVTKGKTDLPLAPPYKLAYMPFLQAHEGIYCRIPGCKFAATKKTVDKHAKEMHKGAEPYEYLGDEKIETMQRFFIAGGGNSYFRVDKTLTTVDTNSNYTLWFHQRDKEEEHRSFTSHVDMSPFHIKSGWLDIVRGCPTSTLRKSVSLSRSTRSPGCIQWVSKNYLGSIIASDMGKIHPSVLKRVQKWKG